MYFPTTHWSLLAKATSSGDDEARRALEELYRRYWSPLHQFIRLRGYTPTEAQDLTQDFLLELLKHATLKKADQDRGRFRSFLLGALVRFLADEYDRQHAQKRGGGALHLSADQEELHLAASQAPDALVFDREWALTILENALRLVEEEFSGRSGAKEFAVLRRFLPGSLEAPSYEEAAAALGLGLAALKSELHRLRLRFKALVRQEIACTVSAPHEIDAEMEYLQQVLMDRGSDWGAHSKPSPPDS